MPPPPPPLAQSGKGSWACEHLDKITDNIILLVLSLSTHEEKHIDGVFQTTPFHKHVFVYSRTTQPYRCFKHGFLFLIGTKGTAILPQLPPETGTLERVVIKLPWEHEYTLPGQQGRFFPTGWSSGRGISPCCRASSHSVYCYISATLSFRSGWLQLVDEI